MGHQPTVVSKETVLLKEHASLDKYAREFMTVSYTIFCIMIYLEHWNSGYYIEFTYWYGEALDYSLKFKRYFDIGHVSVIYM